MGKLIDELGNRYGHLVVIERTHPPSANLRKGDAWWRCRCDCGSTDYISRGHTLRNGQARHCGCLKSEVQSRAQLRSGHLRLPEGQAAFNMLYRYYQRSAKKREIHFELTEEDFSFLTQMNCFYCGDEPDQYVTNQSGSTYCHNGVDRRDPTSGYTMDNVVPCCKVCNIMKRNYRPVPFLWHISKIHNYRGLSHG